MINTRKLLTALLTALLLGLLGFFADFQLHKSKVEAVERRVILVEKKTEQIEEVRAVQCEVALHIFRKDNQTVLRHCGGAGAR